MFVFWEKLISHKFSVSYFEIYWPVVGDLMTVFEDLKLILETIKPRETDIDQLLFLGSGDP